MSEIKPDKPLSQSPEALRKSRLREFSKSTKEGRRDRQETAQRIYWLREDRQGKQAGINERTQEGERAVSVPGRLERERTETEQEILALRAEIRNRAASWLWRVRKFFSRDTGIVDELLRKSSELSDQENRIVGAKQEVTRTLQRLDEELRLLTQQKQAVQIKSKEELEGFYKKYGEKFNAEQKRIRDDEGERRDLAELEIYRKQYGTVPETVKSFNVYIVHGLFLSPGGQNSPLPYYASWRDKLVVEVSERFPVSCSTINQGVPQIGMWSPIGVFIGEGTISDAFYHDAASVATITGEKKVGWGISARNIQEYREHLVRANFRRFPGRLNELILDDKPRSVGFYVNLDQYPPGSRTYFEKQGLCGVDLRTRDANGNLVDRILYSEMFEAAQFVGLPIFGIKGGVAYEAVLNPEGELVLGRAFTPKEIVALRPEIPPENLPKIKEIVDQFTGPNGKSVASVAA